MPTGKLTRDQRRALKLLREEGSGDVWVRQPTELIGGVPAINLATARALERRGLVALTPDLDCDMEAWGEIALTDSGREGDV